ncbi:hypothetical protein, partial [Acinetobacter cumulans]|uniref:hypothetical protein n=1 Tax=Acinetobacter cumulans TaxID=2136182 RepID=UPI001C0828E5
SFVFCLLSFVFCLLSFVFCLLSFVFCLLLRLYNAFYFIRQPISKFDFAFFNRLTLISVVYGDAFFQIKVKEKLGGLKQRFNIGRFAIYLEHLYVSTANFRFQTCDAKAL